MPQASTTTAIDSFDRTDSLVSASWYIIMAVTGFKKLTDRQKDSAFARLSQYLYNSPDEDAAIRLISLKAVIIAVYSVNNRINKEDVFHNLFTDRTRMPVFGIKGHQLDSLKRSDPSLVPALDIIITHLLRYIDDPSQSIIESCNKELQSHKSAGWLQVWQQVLEFKATHEAFY